MSTYFFDAENGTNGATFTNADTPNLTYADTPPTYSNTHTYDGSSMAFYATAPDTATSMFRVMPVSGTMQSMRAYIYLESYPTSGSHIIQVRQVGGNIAVISLLNSGKLYVVDSTSSIIWQSPNAIPLNSWVRIELSCQVGTTATNGILRVAYGLADNAATWTQESLNADIGTVNVYETRFGKPNSGGDNTIWWDNITVTDTTAALLGPSSSNVAPTANAGSNLSNIEPYSTQTLSGSDDDSDGTIVTRTWRQISGTAVQLVGSGANRTYAAPGTIAGVSLTFGYSVTDNSGANSAESVVTHSILPVTERAVIGGVEVPMGINDVSST